MMPITRHKVTPVDLLILSLALGLVAYVAYRLFYGLNYKWNWGIIPTYLIRFDPERERYVANILLEGLLTTIRLSVWGTLLAIIIGFAVGLLRISRRLLYQLLGRTYIETIRNCPPLVLIFIFYYFVSDQLLSLLGTEELLRSLSPGSQEWLALFFADASLINQFLSGVLTLGLFQGAYIAEIVRAGIQAIHVGQWEAGKAIGLNRWQQMRLVILPQGIRIMLPPLAGEFINTIKWSSIVSIISIQELTFQGLQVMATTQATIEVWLTISLFYLVLCLTLSAVVRKLEVRLAQGDGGIMDSPYFQR